MVATLCLSCDVARPWQIVATLLRAAQTQAMYMEVFRNILYVQNTKFVSPTNVARVAKRVGKHYHVGTLAATMCHSFCRPLGSMRVQRVQNSVLVWTANSQACSSTLTIFKSSRGSTENYRLIALNESASELSDGKAGLHVRRKHKHKRKHKPRVNRDDTSARKRNACLFLCFALSRFTRGLCLCLCICLCLRRTCKPALGWG